MGFFSVLSDKFSEILNELTLMVSKINALEFLYALLFIVGIFAGYLVSLLIIFILCAKIPALSPISKNLRKLVFYLFLFILLNSISGHLTLARFLSHAALFIFFFRFIKVADFIMVDIYYSRYAKREVVHIFRDIIKGTLWAIMVLILLKNIFGFSLKDIAITSAVATAAIGFAFQDTLVNLIAGISIFLEKNFKSGDLVQLKSGEVGQVLQTNWRTTRIRNRKNQVVLVPNKELASGEVINYSYYPQVGRIFSLRVSYHNSPAYVKKSILDYLKTFPEVLEFPITEVFTKEYKEYYLEYEVRFFINNVTQALQIEDKIKTGIWYLFKRKGIRIPYPLQHVLLKDKEDLNYQKPQELFFMSGDNLFEAVDKNSIIFIVKGKLNLINKKTNEVLSFFEIGQRLIISEKIYNITKNLYVLKPQKELTLKILSSEELSKEFYDKILEREESIITLVLQDQERNKKPNIKKEESFIENFLSFNFNKQKKE